jgi:Uma2 family endonuclease
MPALVALPEQRSLLYNITWETYERLLAEREWPGPRIAYDKGALEIRTVYKGHESPNWILARLVQITAVETRGDFDAAGSMTLKRKDLGIGVEPDASFYFRHASLVRGRDEIDVTVDPPPELVIEVDITRSSLPKLPIFAAIGIAEVWRYDGERVFFHALEGDAYRLIEKSWVLPPMTASQAGVFLEMSRHEPAGEWETAVRDWVRNHNS